MLSDSASLLSISRKHSNTLSYSKNTTEKLDGDKERLGGLDNSYSADNGIRLLIGR